MSDMPDYGTVKVRLRWSGYQVVAVSQPDKRGVRRWHEIRDVRQLVPLPADVVPEAWQPEDGNRWQWPNGRKPDPLRATVAPQLSQRATVAFAEVTAAEAAEMAAEMEEWRRAPVARGERIDRGLPWWRDVTRIRYEATGAVSREHGEARILRALILEWSIPLDLKPYRTNAAALAALKLTLADVLADRPDEDWMPPLKPMPEDWRDFEVVLGWFAEVMPSRRELHVLRGRMATPPKGWTLIGAECRRSAEWARTTYNTTLDVLIEAANRAPRRRLRRLKELQERNRRAKL